MNCNAPGLPVHHQIPKLAQTHVHQDGHAIQPSHPVIPFPSCLQSFPASGSFWMSQLFVSGGQSIGVSASSSVLPMNTQGWSPCSSRDSQESSPTPQFKSINSSNFFMVKCSHSVHNYCKNHSFILWTFVGKVMSLLFKHCLGLS